MFFLRYTCVMQYVRTGTVQGITFEYVIKKRKKQKNCTLAVRKGGRVTLTIPYNVSLSWAETFLSRKEDWLYCVFKKYPPQKNSSVKERREKYLKHKEYARHFIRVRISELNAVYGFVYGNITIRNNVSRWGSCSSKNNLNFDYRILFLPKHLQDYVLVHELCHLQEMNHSARFWKLIEKILPEYKKLRSELRGYFYSV